MIKKISKYGGGKQIPNRIVIHSMAEYINDIEIYTAVAYLEKLKLSAHYFILPDGDIIKGREDDDIAWHARGFNTGSIGIEFLAKGTHDYGTFLAMIKLDYIERQQFASGIALVSELMQKYAIEQVDRHSDLSPGRKLDPGSGFKYSEFLQKIR